MTLRCTGTLQHLLGGLAGLLGLLAVTAAAIAFSLRVTPAQPVSTLGQQIQVGTASPTLSLSGPGVLDLFGQSIPTEARFAGPVRPQLDLTKITINRQVASFVTATEGRSGPAILGRRLAGGWTRYFIWQAAFVAIGAALLALAYVGLRRRSWRRSLVTVLLVVVVAEAIDLGFVMETAYSAPRVLSKVRSLSELVGQSPQPLIAPASGPPIRGVQAVVLGDSTASGLGNPLVARPSAVDRACFRSSDAYAVDLASVNGWKVKNLACSGATIPAGILGPQAAGSRVVPPQLAVARRASGVKAIFVSVGADDVGWDTIVRLCAVSPSCDNSASTAYFQRMLYRFTKDYYQLLGQLAAFPGHPEVIVNQYYDPFDPSLTCLDRVGLTAAKQRVLVQRLDALNTVIAKGAQATGFETVQPDFSGHGLCTSVPYVQSLEDAAPFHPTPAGELAIALSDEEAFLAGRS